MNNELWLTIRELMFNLSCTLSKNISSNAYWKFRSILYVPIDTNSSDLFIQLKKKLNEERN
jgi:hypothetical protein